jgi:hypothetical protein
VALVHRIGRGGRRISGRSAARLCSGPLELMASISDGVAIPILVVASLTLAVPFS